MPGTVPRRAGHVLNLQPVALYSLVCCRCEMEISNNTDARMKFKRLKKKYGYAAKETLGNFRMSLFDFMWISGLPSPAQHRGWTAHMSQSSTSYRSNHRSNILCRFTFRGKRRELAVKIQRPRPNHIWIPSFMIIHCVSKCIPVATRSLTSRSWWLTTPLSFQGPRGRCHYWDMVMAIPREHRPVAGLCF